MATEFKQADEMAKRHEVTGANFDLGHGDVVIAAITSCTNTSNPTVMIGAGLLARNAAKFGLKVKPWVKTSLAPGSQVVTEYLKSAGLQKDLNKMGFDLVGYGCTTCIGNSGPLPENISETIKTNDLVACSVLSGNRNFRGPGQPGCAGQLSGLAAAGRCLRHGRVHECRPDNRSAWPYAQDGKPVYLADIWPDAKEVADSYART